MKLAMEDQTKIGRPVELDARPIPKNLYHQLRYQGTVYPHYNRTHTVYDDLKMTRDDNLSSLKHVLTHVLMRYATMI